MIVRPYAVALLSAMSLTACSGPVTQEAVDAKALLAASTAGLTAGNYRYTIDMPDERVEGVNDTAAHSAAWTTTLRNPGVDEVEIRLIGSDQYTRSRRDAASIAAEKKSLRKIADADDDPAGKAKLAASIRELDAADDRFQHIDLARIPETAARMGLADAALDRTSATKLLPLVQTATPDGPAIRGTLSIAAPISGDIALSSVGSRLVGTLNFTAALDGKGRLSRLQIDLPAEKKPAAPAGQWTLTIDSYGTAPAPEPPSAVKEAPEDLYEAMN